MTTQPTAQIHTVLGAGQVGTLLARRLAAAGHTVHLVRRGPATCDIAGVRWFAGDITDERFADDVCRGASVVYNCLNPSQYHRWDTLLPPLFRAAIGAASRHDARLVVLDNLYMYGRPSRAPFDEAEPMNPCSRKGALRARLATELLDAHTSGAVRVAIGRASDYFGPGTPFAVVFGPRFYQRLAAGKPIEVMGDPNQPHSYSYTPDVAAGLMTLGARDDALGRVWHLPVAAQLCTRELVERFAAAAGTTAELRVVPTWMVRALGLVIRPLSAVAEMVYQWEVPYLADDSAFRTTFGATATELDLAIKTSLTANGLDHAAVPSSTPVSSIDAKLDELTA